MNIIRQNIQSKRKRVNHTVLNEVSNYNKKNPCTHIKKLSYGYVPIDAE